MGSKTITRRKKIHRRIRRNIAGTAERPRLSVYRSNKGIYVQVIDDDANKTLVSASFKEVNVEGNKTAQAAAVGRLIAEKAIEKGITRVIFDRGGYLYHGRVKALADGARGEKKEDGTNELLQF